MLYRRNCEISQLSGNVAPASYYKWMSFQHWLDVGFIAVADKLLQFGKNLRLTPAFLRFKIPWIKWEYKPKLLQQLAHAIHYR